MRLSSVKKDRQIARYPSRVAVKILLSRQSYLNIHARCELSVVVSTALAFSRIGISSRSSDFRTPITLCDSKTLSAMQRWVGKIAIVTGASAGIGAAVAKILVKNGLEVIGLARRIDRVNDLASQLNQYPGNLHARECDLTKEEDILGAFRWIKDKWGGVDVLVNNAGVLRYSTLTDGSTEDWRQTFDVNVLAVCICTRESLKLMENREYGHVINICSTAGHRVPSIVPLFANVYPASKFALRAISDTLRMECTRDKRKIKVTNLSPGTVATEIVGGIENLRDKLTEKDIAELSSHTAHLQSEDIAESVLYVLGTPQHVEIRELIIGPLGEGL